MQVYNLQQDEKTKKPSAKIDYEIVNLANNQPVLHSSESTEQHGQCGDQITLEKSVTLNSFQPGVYRLTVKLTTTSQNSRSRLRCALLSSSLSNLGSCGRTVSVRRVLNPGTSDKGGLQHDPNLAHVCAGGLAVRGGNGRGQPGSIRGYVKNTAGAPQMGATVSCSAVPGQPSGSHRYQGLFSRVRPGCRQLRCRRFRSFLPAATLREDVFSRPAPARSLTSL